MGNGDSHSFTLKCLESIFFGHATKRVEEIRDRGTRLSHYTSARVALSILDNRQVWLRNARIMNDYSEMHYGQSLLDQAWEGPAGKALSIELKNIHERIHSYVGERIHGLARVNANNTYLMSLSEHGDATFDEDKYGRLSMWRAYGGKCNVCLVLKSGPFVSETTAISAFSSPVFYADADLYNQEIMGVVKRLKDAREEMKALSPLRLAETIVRALQFSVLSTKHPGFSEEREWRVIYNHSLASPVGMEADTVLVDEIPQKIYKLNLEEYPEQGFTGASPEKLIDKIIIGPTEFPNAIKEVFVEKLTQLNFDSPEERVVVSTIPMRRH